MFDKLIESTKQKRAGRTSRFFLTTTIAYAGALALFAVATVFWFNPALASTADIAELIPPVPLAPQQPAPVQVSRNIQPEIRFAPPTTPPVRIPDVREVPPSTPSSPSHYIPGTPNLGTGPSVPGPGIPGASSEGEPAPPPPPAATPKPSPTATPTPEGPMRVTSQMIQSKAIRKIQPAYPSIAKTAGVAGPVQVQFVLSENGTIDEASVISGHPLLRAAALQAAKQWVFSPTLLNGKAVRVVGVITFNFTLN
ncbi:MAG TPA: TonB family protein [Blastocatellia bacterium]|nr:TonB family protein [Blastocatellia bacterium]